jgi:hypothetical protein
LAASLNSRTERNHLAGWRLSAKSR